MAVERDAGLDLQIRWSFLPLLGKIGSSYGERPGLLARVLPMLSTYLIDPNDGLAARAISAWCSIQHRHVVPSTLEDLLPALIENQTVVVATALMESTPGLRLTEGSKFALLRRAVMLCEALTVQGDTGLLKAAITASCILGREFVSIRSTAELVALSRADELDGYDLGRVLDLPWSAETQASARIAELRLRQVGDPDVNDRYNQNDDRQVVDLLSTGKGLEHLGLAAMTQVALSFGAESAIRGLEMAEVAWRAGRVGDALQIVAAIEALVPSTQAFDRQRRLIALAKEVLQRKHMATPALHDLEENDDPGLLSRWQQQACDRAHLRELLRDTSDASADTTSTETRADALLSVAKRLNAQGQRATPTAAYVRAIASLASLAGRLLRLEQAEDDGDAELIGSSTRSVTRGQRTCGARSQGRLTSPTRSPRRFSRLSTISRLPSTKEI